ncbi:MAG: hypothetical protein WHX52_18035 [Anaerolineae bacterium]
MKESRPLTPYPLNKKAAPFKGGFCWFWYTLSYYGLICANATALVLPLRSTIITNTTSNSPSKGLLGVMRARIAFWARWSVSIIFSLGLDLISLHFTTESKYVK